MKRFSKVLLGLVLGTLIGCASSSMTPGITVSVQFDPDDYDQREMQGMALAMCKAKNYSRTALYAEQPTMVRGNWAYRTYACY